MVTKGEKSYIKELHVLWADVFGDNDEYIDLFFEKQYASCETFLEICDDEVVSALYLLPCKLHYNNEVYCGRYLYAAATKTQYRSRGIMSKLINEAKLYCKNNNIDFISLVPANEQLYDYYKKFSFIDNMYKYKFISRKGETAGSLYDISDSEYCSMRNKMECNFISFGENEFGYIISAMKSYGCELLGNEKFYLIYNKDENIIEELIFLNEDNTHDVYCVNHSCYSPYDSIFNEECEKMKFGMICPINKNLTECENIYMNLALD